jgi:hypothetical protein
METWQKALLAGAGVATLTYLVTAPSRVGGRVRVAGGVLYGPGGVSYRITPTDVLWLKRMIVGEGGDRPSRRSVAALLWAMANYHMLVEGPRGARPRFSTLTALLRAYSQPLNPLWSSATTSKCQAYPHLCTSTHLARRARIQRQSSFTEDVEVPLDDFLAGRLDNPVPGLVDWRAGSWSGCRVNVEGNCFGVSPGRNLA